MESLFQNSYTEPLKFKPFEKIGHIDILRDDRIHPVVCGNKWRKLKHVISYLQANNFKRLVTFGGAYSNHVVATAFAGDYFDIQTHAFIRGDENRPLNHYEELCITHHMQLTHVDRSTYRNKEVLFNQYYKDRQDVFFLDEGGNHPLALKGCSEIINELSIIYNHIILPLGTGTTMEGLLTGIHEHGLPTKITGISSLKNNTSLNVRMQKFNPSSWEILHNYHRGKYGAIDDELLMYCNHFTLSTGIPLEPVYTGKMMMAVDDLISNDYFKPDDKILLVHTGGLLSAAK